MTHFSRSKAPLSNKTLLPPILFFLFADISHAQAQPRREKPTHAHTPPTMDPELVLDPLPEDFLCPICYMVVHNAYQCRDGHLFCAKCIIHWLQNNSTCPMDRAPCTTQSLVACRAVNNIVLTLHIRCPHSCPWKGTLADLESHNQTCPFFALACAHCGTQTLRSALPDHLQTCPSRPVPCPLCATLYPLDGAPAHNLECPAAPASCSNPGCDFSSTRHALQLHIASYCPFQQIRCALHVEGCRFSSARSKMHAHYRACIESHSRMATRHIRRMRQRINVARTTLAASLHTLEQSKILRRTFHSIRRGPAVPLPPDSEDDTSLSAPLALPPPPNLLQPS